MKTLLLVFLMTVVSLELYSQILLGSAKSQINFREGPGTDFKVVFTIDHSNLLVILPREPKNNFIEVFDIESSSSGFVSQNLITIVDTLYFQKQHFFERSGENEKGEIEIELINQTSKTLFLWINSISYSLSPHEKKVLLMDKEDITYFSSAPGLFPVFGREILQKGNTYRWNFTL